MWRKATSKNNITGGERVVDSEVHYENAVVVEEEPAGAASSLFSSLSSSSITAPSGSAATSMKGIRLRSSSPARTYALWGAVALLVFVTFLVAQFAYTTVSHMTCVNPINSQISSYARRSASANQPARLAMQAAFVPQEQMEKFTMIVATFRRQDLFPKVIRQYCHLPEVEEVLLVWNNIDLDKFPPPDGNSFGCPKEVRVLTQKENQVQNRLLLAEEVSTDAIFQVDDDIIIDPQDIQIGFNVWKGNRDTIVGYAARVHEYNLNNNEYEYFTRPWERQHNTFSILIGQAMFIHKKYHAFYASDTPITNKVRRYVVGKSCCDDIAMNFLVTSQSGQAPILIDTDVEDMVSSDSSSFSGKSTAGGWRHKRSRAVKDYVSMFGFDPLVYSDRVVTHWAPYSWSWSDCLPFRWTEPQMKGKRVRHYYMNKYKD